MSAVDVKRMRTFTWQDPQTVAAQAAGLTGLAVMQAIAAGSARSRRLRSRGCSA